MSCVSFKLIPYSYTSISYGGLNGRLVIIPEYLKAVKPDNRLLSSTVILGSFIGMGLTGKSEYLLGVLGTLIIPIVNNINAKKVIQTEDKHIEKWLENYNSNKDEHFKLYKFKGNQSILLPDNAASNFIARNSEELMFYTTNLMTNSNIDDFIVRSIKVIDINGFVEMQKKFPNNPYILNEGNDLICKKYAQSVTDFNGVLEFRKKFGNNTKYDNELILNVYDKLTISGIQSLMDWYPNSYAAIKACEYAIANAQNLNGVYSFLKYNGKFDNAISKVVEMFFNKTISNSNSPKLLKVIKPINNVKLSSLGIDTKYVKYSEEIKSINVDGKFLLLGMVTNPYNYNVTMCINANCKRDESSFYKVELPTSEPIYINLKANETKRFAININFERYQSYYNFILNTIETNGIIDIRFSSKIVSENVVPKNNQINQDEMMNRALNDKHYICSEPYGYDGTNKISLKEIKKSINIKEQKVNEFDRTVKERLAARKAKGLPSYDLVERYFNDKKGRYEYIVDCYGYNYHGSPNRETIYHCSDGWYVVDSFGISDNKIYVNRDSTFEQAAEYLGSKSF